MVWQAILGPSLLWLYGSWIYNYLCNQCLPPLKLWVWIPFMAKCTRHNIIRWIINSSPKQWVFQYMYDSNWKFIFWLCEQSAGNLKMVITVNMSCQVASTEDIGPFYLFSSYLSQWWRLSHRGWNFFTNFASDCSSVISGTSSCSCSFVVVINDVSFFCASEIKKSIKKQYRFWSCEHRILILTAFITWQLS